MLPLISSAGYSGMRLTITHTRLSAPGRVWVPSPFRPVLLSIVSDAKQLLNEYLLNYMEPATEHSHSPQVSPLQPEKRLAGLRGAVCRLSSEASETACSLHQPSEHPEADDSTWSRPGPGVTGACTPWRPRAGPPQQWPWEPSKAASAWPRVEPGRGQRAAHRSRPRSWSDIWVSQPQEDWRGVSVLGWKAQRGSHGHFFSCKTGRKRNGKNKRGAPSAQRRKMEKTHCTWDALSTVIPRGRRNHPVLKCEVGLTSPVSQSVLEHAS